MSETADGKELTQRAREEVLQRESGVAAKRLHAVTERVKNLED